MAKGGGIALKSLSLFLRFIQFCTAAIIIGIFSYFLATLHNHSLHIDTYIRAVEGISGAAVLYTLIALLLVCCLGGIAFFSFIGILLDLAFAGAFGYVIYATRGGAHNCRGYVNTPFGSGSAAGNNAVTGNTGGITILPSLHTACELEKVCFAVAVIGCVFFLLSIPVELLLMRHHKKEKAYGPSPSNGYTAGSGRRKFWQRKPKNTRDVEKNPDALPAHATPADTRASYATEATAVGAEPVVNKYGNTAPVAPTADYSTAPAGTAPVYGSTGAGVGYANGYGNQTTTTTHVPADGYVRTHQPYNDNPTANF